jgi:23S rRNA G2069 N7-methylase RlmK/C1962 C5-methylase RlmI
MKVVLDMCCGSRMFYFNKDSPLVEFCDNRVLNNTLCDGRKLEICPDTIADFRDLPFEDNSYHLIVFDPPHLLKAGEKSWLAQKYGVLNRDTWKEDIAKGFDEGMRVLKPFGVLIFKWNEDQIKLSEILKAITYEPIIGNKRSKTHWLVFMKVEEE